MIVIINFKTYKEGSEALELAKKIKRVDGKVIIGVQATNINEIFRETKLKIYAQHVDSYLPGRNTGDIIPETVKASGATGTFLNHSEHKLSFDVIKETVKRCKKVGLRTAVFAKSLDEARRIEKLKPDYLIYEPPELVAGKTSVSTSKPEVIKKISKNIKMKFLVGAGIKNRKDVEKSIELGASGIAISSAITTAKDPGKVLKELFGK